MSDVHNETGDVITIQNCLDEINNALNYWYPLKPDCDETECNARHVRLFGFRDRLQAQLENLPQKPTASSSPMSSSGSE